MSQTDYVKLLFNKLVQALSWLFTQAVLLVVFLGTKMKRGKR